MAELAFLAADVDEDPENVEDLDDNSDEVDNLPDRWRSLTSKNEFMSENNSDAVEICQNTVNPNNRVTSEDFKIHRVIGKGGYGKVFLVQKITGVDCGKLYAMKVLKKARIICNEKDKAHTVSERNILEMLRHPFLVRLHYAFQNHSNLYIVLEYCPGGELFSYLEHEGALLENAACFYTAEIALAIGHLHSLGIIYRDLKSENVLLDRQGHVKLTDFGLSKEGVCTTNTFCGTIEYMAPEIIKCEGHGKAVDWWSLGTLLFDMLSGGPPFSQEENREITTRKILFAPLVFPPAFSPEVTSLIRGLLKRDPKERLGSRNDVEEIKLHKFFRYRNINWSDVYHRRLRPPFVPKLSTVDDTSMFDPNFTQLQPVVSPPDNGRSIPPDLFQGFSYVAPTVCEEFLRESGLDEPATCARRRRHNTPGALSAGRLRRLDPGPQRRTGGSHLQNLPSHRSDRQTTIKPGKPTRGAPTPDFTNEPLSVNGHFNGTTVTPLDGDLPFTSADDGDNQSCGEDDYDDDDDDDGKGEHIPGAKPLGQLSDSSYFSRILDQTRSELRSTNAHIPASCVQPVAADHRSSKSPAHTNPLHSIHSTSTVASDSRPLSTGLKSKHPTQHVGAVSSHSSDAQTSSSMNLPSGGPNSKCCVM